MRSRDLVSFLLFCFFIPYFFHGGEGYIDRGMAWMGGGSQAPLICSLSLCLFIYRSINVHSYVLIHCSEFYSMKNAFVERRL